MKSLVFATLLSSMITPGLSPQTKHEPLPSKCPSVFAIVAEKINHVTPFPAPMSGSQFWWTGMIENSSFDTNDNWTMMIMIGSPERNGREILKQMTASTHSLELFEENTPQWDDSLGAAICAYRDKESDIGAIAIYPPLYSDATIKSK